MTKEEFAKSKSLAVISRVYERKLDNTLHHHAGNRIQRIDREGLRCMIEKCVLAGIEWKERGELSMTDKEKKRLYDIQNVPVDEDKLKNERRNAI